MAIVRTGMAWPSLVCWLVILIGAGSSEVGARSAPVGRKRGARACKVTGDWGPSCAHRRSGWAGVSQCRESAARPRSRPGGPVRRLGGSSGARRWARQRGGRRRLAERGGGEASRAARASPAYGSGSHRGGCCDSVSPRNWPVATYAIGPLQPAIGPLQPVRGPDSERKAIAAAKPAVSSRPAATIAFAAAALALAAATEPLAAAALAVAGALAAAAVDAAAAAAVAPPTAAAVAPGPVVGWLLHYR